MAAICVLGAGRMGAAIITAFAKAGHDVTVWNRTASKAAALAAVGARAATDVAQAVAGADLVVSVVSDYEASAALLASDGLARAARGKTFLELASGTPKQARRAAAWAEGHGVGYLDGAIMATPDFIGQPGCTIVYSGPASLFDDWRATLAAALADGGLHVGAEIGQANALDNAILAVLWGSVHGLFQGAAIGEAEGLSLETFGGALKGAWPVVEPMLFSTLGRIAKRHYDADATTLSTVAPCYATSRHVYEVSREHGLDLGLPEAVRRVFQRAVDAGHLDSDVAAAYEGVRRP